MTSEVSRILASAQDQLRRIDDLERRVNDRAVRARRRIANLLLEHTAPSHRHSHLRCFMTHQYKKIEPTDTSPLPASEWNLRLEGKLLIGHKDHESAVAHDQKTGYVAPTDDLDRSKGEKEEEEVTPIKFTHFFDKIEAQFQPIYSPKPNPMAAAIAKKKSPSGKKRRGGSSKAAALPKEDDETFLRSLVVNPTKHGMVWQKSLSEDAHAFDFCYRAPPPHESRYQIHSVVATLQLYPSTKEPRFKVSPKLLQALFPNHSSNQAEQPPQQQPSKPGSNSNSSKKRPAPADEEPLPNIPMEAEIDIPETWSMSDLSAAVYQYIADHRLFDETSPSTIVCNDTLKEVFQLERFSFAQLQSLLLTHDLIRQNPNGGGVDPVSITYICKDGTATNAPEPDAFTVTTFDDEDRVPALLQLDMDIWVPSLFPFRCREILRRIKRRELEYTSSRTKARYILMNRKAKDEEDVKTKIEDVVARQQLGRDLIPVQVALAKAALPRTEARMASHMEARLSHLMDRVDEEFVGAQDKWQECQNIIAILEKASKSSSSNGNEETRAQKTIEQETEPMDTS